jgi:arginase
MILGSRGAGELGSWGDNSEMFRLLVPEWQGYGLSPEPGDGARVLAREWWDGTEVTVAEAPRAETLEVDGGILGLASIAPRTEVAMSLLRTAAPLRVQMIAGTCGADVAPVAYLNDLYAGDLAVVWLDGHADLNTPESSPSGHFHGMALRTLLGDGHAALTTHIGRSLRPEQVFLVGSRDLDPPERDYIESRAVTWMRDEAFANTRHLIDAITAAGFTKVYVHFDMDVINPADFANALIRADDGPLLAEVADVLSGLHRHLDVVGFSVLEYCDRGDADRQRLLTVLRALDANGCCR